MPQRRTRQFLSRGARPNRSWSGFTNTGPISVAASTKVLLGSFSLSNPSIDETILRNVGTLAVQSDNFGADEVQIGAFGMIVVTDIAIAAGAASIPGPITNFGDDGWFVYVPIVQGVEFLSAVGVNPDAWHQYDFDSKAKRIVSEGQNLALMVENASSSFAFEVMAVFRTLSQVRGTR